MNDKKKPIYEERKQIYIGVPWDEIYGYRSRIKETDDPVAAANDALRIIKIEKYASDSTKVVLLRSVKVKVEEPPTPPLRIKIKGKSIENVTEKVTAQTKYSAICKGTGEILDPNSRYAAVIHFYDEDDYAWSGGTYYKRYFDLIEGDNLESVIKKLPKKKYSENEKGNTDTGLIGLVVAEANYNELMKGKEKNG